MEVSQDEIPLSLINNNNIQQDEALEDVSPDYNPVPEPTPPTPTPSSSSSTKEEEQPKPPVEHKDSLLDKIFAKEEEMFEEIDYIDLEPLSETKSLHFFLLVFDLFLCFISILLLFKVDSVYRFFTEEISDGAKLAIQICLPIIYFVVGFVCLFASIKFKSNVSLQVFISILFIIFDILMVILFALDYFYPVLVFLVMISLPNCFIGLWTLAKRNQVSAKSELIFSIIVEVICIVGVCLLFYSQEHFKQYIITMITVVISTCIKFYFFKTDGKFEDSDFELTVFSEIIKVNCSVLVTIAILLLLEGVLYVLQGIYFVIREIIKFVSRYWIEIIGVGVCILCCVGVIFGKCKD